MKPVTTQNTIPGVADTASRSDTVLKAVKILAAAFILISAFIWKIPVVTRTYGYWTIREIFKVYTVARAWDMEKLTSEHFYVKFRPEDRADAELVLETAEYFYRPVTEDFGYTPRARVPIVLHSSKAELNRSFGWEAKESAIGVYYAGVIKVLAPQSWIYEDGPDSIKETFISSGPIAHEFTHLMIDYLTGGNYPRWFTEGMAQYEEYKLTGFTFNDPAGAVNHSAYSMEDIAENFDGLPNQSLAYKEAFAAIRYIANVYGEKTLHDLIKSLGNGMEFENAMQKYLKLDYAGLEKCRQEWALSNI
ncbi:MAG: peptidase MA family metallohydrolase [Desulfotomaculaceae bacterium]|nr:peptidase MA family metallohydrolase [Desulfotomaculaceae bacterium]MDD4767997.1 peptidase MA family metallohydrolase [Desulfotomaculaceae bacterium]